MLVAVILQTSMLLALTKFLELILKFSWPSQGGIWNTLQDATKERPWLWAVYIIVILLPIVLIIACCLPSKKVIQYCQFHSTYYSLDFAFIISPLLWVIVVCSYSYLALSTKVFFIQRSNMINFHQGSFTWCHNKLSYVRNEITH